MNEIRHVVIDADQYDKWVKEKNHGIDIFPDREEIYVNPHNSEEFIK